MSKEDRRAAGEDEREDASSSNTTKKKGRAKGASDASAAPRMTSEPDARDVEPSAPPESSASSKSAPSAPSAWLAVLAFAPAVLVLGAVAQSVIAPSRNVVFTGLGVLSAIVAAIFALVPLAIVDRDRKGNERALWTAALLFMTTLVAPGFWAMRIRPGIREAVASTAKRWVRVGRGLGVATFGFGTTFLLMANEEQIVRGPLWGMLTVLLGTVGMLDVFGVFSSAGEERISWRATSLVARDGELVVMSPIVGVPLALIVLLIGVPVGGYDRLPITLAIALLALLPSALRRPGLLVFVVAGLLYLPLLGAYGLWDPWETHYGEVAREILSRDDWISLWWAQEDWFWSKPILIFWSEALSMGALGVDFHPDANPLHPEWAIRLPHFLLTMGALLSVYALVSRVWSKRAGLVAALVLATMPHFFLLAHQAITDMPFVSTMTMAMCMLGLAIVEDPEREVKRYALGPITVSARHLVIAAITLVIVPQFLYLFSRNVTFMATLPPFGWHGDTFLHGSAGNHGVPGNAPVHNVEPYLSGPGAQPITQGLVWLLGYVGILLLLLKEKRAQSLYVFAFYLFCGLSFMAKGIPGFALPGLVALLFLFGARRWDLLLDGRLRVGAGMLVVAVTGMPWYVAMYIRHGPPFTERLLIHDHINRLTAGVHGDTGSIEYFIEQMGYGLFPWIAMAPLALAGWLELRKDASEPAAARTRRREIAMLVMLWLAGAFTLFSAMTTKFHHYIFPAVPPAGILVGLAMSRLLGPEPERFAWRPVAGAALSVLAPIPAVLGIAGLWGDVRGVIPEEITGAQAADWVLAHPWSTSTCLALIGLGIGLLAAAVWVLAPGMRAERRWKPAAVTTGLLAAPVLVGLVGRDLSWVTDARPQGYERLIHLFVYNYGRPWPEQFDYRPILTGFVIVATIIVLLAAARPLRAAASRAFLGVSLLFAVWALDVYMVDLSPHWGQAELVHRYYELRSGPDEPLVAWQMNWKGENFYTGNRVSVFVQLDNRALTDWLRQNQGRTAFFLLEHSRLGSLRGVLRDSTVEEISTERLNNKFILVRAHIGRSTPPAARETRD